MTNFLTHPFSLSQLEAKTTTPGRMLLCRCPGLRSRPNQEIQPGIGSALESDLEMIIGSGASTLISLIGYEERKRLGVSELPAQTVKAGLDWHEFAIADRAAPDRNRQFEFSSLMTHMLNAMLEGKTIVVHCQAGIGRTGLVAASALVWRGMSPEDAISHVRAARPGAIETEEQEAFVRTLKVTV